MFGSLKALAVALTALCRVLADFLPVLRPLVQEYAYSLKLKRSEAALAPYRAHLATAVASGDANALAAAHAALEYHIDLVLSESRGDTLPDLRGPVGSEASGLPDSGEPRKEVLPSDTGMVGTERELPAKIGTEPEGLPDADPKLDWGHESLDSGPAQLSALGGRLLTS